MKNHFSKEKREKKKAFQKGGVAKKPKGNGISAEGWQGIKNNIGEADHIALPLCRSLLAFLLCGSPDSYRDASRLFLRPFFYVFYFD